MQTHYITNFIENFRAVILLLTFHVDFRTFYADSR